jgi:hypothetical protein
VDNTVDRFQDFQSTEKFTDSLATELIPWARTNLHVDVGGNETTAAGGAFKSRDHPLSRCAA